MSHDPLPHDFTGAVEPSAQIETFEASPQTLASTQLVTVDVEQKSKLAIIKVNKLEEARWARDPTRAGNNVLQYR